MVSFPVFFLDSIFNFFPGLARRWRKQLMPGKVSKRPHCTMINDQSSGNKQLLTSDQTSTEQAFQAEAARGFLDTLYYLAQNRSAILEIPSWT